MARVIRHAFLTPGHNCWSLWTSEKSENIVNEGVSHRVLEILVYAVDRLARDGWRVEKINVEQGNPNLVMLTKEEETAG